jgi:hypothetical protein
VRRAVVRILVAAAVVLAASVLTAVPAQAGVAARGSAYNVRHLDLQWPGPAGATSCVERQIILAAGWYRWDTVDSPNSNGTPASRQIYLAAGGYVWSDCIAWSSQPAWYWHYSWLDLGGDGGAARLGPAILENRTNDFVPVPSRYGSALTQL